ncbi:transcription regulator LuxR [Rhodopirellula sp. SWK7]|nr:transcription regulator LuxR [Rhodopirellula sp. SWK7]
MLMYTISVGGTDHNGATFFPSTLIYLLANMDSHLEKRVQHTPRASSFVTSTAPNDQTTRWKNARIPVVVIHPGSIERLGIHHSWSTSSFVEVCGVAADCDEAHEYLVDKTVRVAILGLATGSNSSATVNVSILRDTLRRYPTLKWIVLSPQPCPDCREAAKAAGAIGYFDHPQTSEQLESAVAWADLGRLVGWHDSSSASHKSAASHNDPAHQDAGPPATSAHEAVHHQPIQRSISTSEKDKWPNYVWKVDPSHASQAAPQSAGSAPNPSAGLKQLSAREREVLEGLAAGQTNQQIADGLFLSVKTIETYRSRLKQKLGLKDRADIVAFFNSRV